MSFASTSIDSYIPEQYKKDKYFTQDMDNHLREDDYAKYLTYIDKQENRAELEGAISSSQSTTLIDSYRNTQQVNAINWDELFQLIDFQLLLKEYAKFFARRNQWVMQCEIEIIAFALNIGIDLYNVEWSYDRYNVECSNRIAIRFNGTNHYERLTFSESDRSRQMNQWGLRLH